MYLVRDSGGAGKMAQQLKKTRGLESGAPEPTYIPGRHGGSPVILASKVEMGSPEQAASKTSHVGEI